MKTDEKQASMTIIEDKLSSKEKNKKGAGRKIEHFILCKCNFFKELNRMLKIIENEG